VSDDPRVEDLRRRVEKDPASIAFAQLGEEFRRAGRFGDAIDTCRAGLARHPAYLSARVTLGRSLIALGDFDQAERELTLVLRTAPENPAALRGLAEIEQHRGNLPEALVRYEAALGLVPHDPELNHLVRALRHEIERAAAPLTKTPASAVPPVSAPTPRPTRVVEPPRPTRVLDPDLRVLPVLEKWLDCILSDRQERALERWQGQ
jgi:Flp pilus assembly protein TadD